MKAQRLLFAFLVLLLAAAQVEAQAATAGMTGIVKDSDGGALPGVTLTLKNPGTGFVRATTSSGEGRFGFTGLVPDTYDLTAELSSFARFENKGVRLSVGQVVPVTVVMKPAGVEASVTVTGEREAIQTTVSEVSNVINNEIIQAVPVADRNTITLALLAPGVGATPYFDPTKSRDNFDGFGFGGGSASSTWTLVDGGDNNDDVVGSILQFYPQDSIQEFEVISSRFGAEYGHTDGGVVNMITKSGSNDLSGSGYWLLRDKALNARTFAEEDAGAEKPDFHQYVIGGSIGGPIMKDKAFYFGNADYTKRTRNLFTTGNGVIAEVDAQGQVPQDFDQTLAVAKFNANLNSSNFMTARYAYQDDSILNVNMGSNDSIDHGGLGANSYHAFLLKNQTVFGGDKLNEAFWQFNRFKNTIDSNAAGGSRDNRELLVDIYSLGQNINHPQRTDQDKHQFQDTFSWRSSWKGDHDFKAGFEYIHIKVGGFFTNSRPFAQFIWGDSARFNAGLPADEVDIFNGPAFFVGESTNNLYSLFLQDDWKPTERLTLNLGLRWDVETNDWTQQTRTFLSSDPVFFGGQPETDSNNFGPRAGFAYDVNGDGNLVVRGGYGLYYQQIFWNSPIRLQFAEGELQDAFALTGAAITFTPDSPFCAAPGMNASGCIPFPVVPPPVAADFVGSSGLTSADPRMNTPQNHQFTAGFSAEVAKGFAFDADYVHTFSNSQIYRIRVGGNPSINGLPTANMGARATVNTQGAELRYNGLLLAARTRWKDLAGQFSYTFGRGQGHMARQTDRVVVDGGGDFEDNFGTNFTQRDHLFAGSITYNLPYEFQLGAIVRFQSGFAFNGFDPTLGVDIDGDLRTNETLADTALGSPDGTGHRGEFRGDGFSQVDLRIAKKFTLAGKYRPQAFFEVFNLFNSRNEKPDDVNTNIRSATFSQSTSVAGQPLQAQFSLRFDF